MTKIAEELSSGLFCIDTEFRRPRMDAAYLMMPDFATPSLSASSNKANHRWAPARALRLYGDALACQFSPAFIVSIREQMSHGISNLSISHNNHPPAIAIRNNDDRLTAELRRSEGDTLSVITAGGSDDAGGIGTASPTNYGHARATALAFISAPSPSKQRCFHLLAAEANSLYMNKKLVLCLAL